MIRRFVDRAISKIVSNSHFKKLFHHISKADLFFQENYYIKHGFDRKLAVLTLNKTLNKIYGKNYSEDLGMWSEHLILFAAIKNRYPNIKNILEIGTFDGQTARILSDLFPNSFITTLDLPSRDIKDKGIYQYAQKNNHMENLRNENLSKCVNVNFVESTSLSLFMNTSLYDLIWIDGAHGYPVVAIDIANSIRICSSNGLILCDDVYKFNRSNDSEYKSTATYETLFAFRESGFIEFSLFIKRINKIYKFNKKYVGLVRKLNM